MEDIDGQVQVSINNLTRYVLLTLGPSRNDLRVIYPTVSSTTLSRMQNDGLVMARSSHSYVKEKSVNLLLNIRKKSMKA